MRRSIYPNGSGGGSGDFVSLNTFDTYAELDAQAAEDGNLGLVASGTEGEPRLFRYDTDTWIPDEPVVWTIATTGAGVMTGLIDAAGEAVYPGDLGVDGNGTVYYAAGHGGRCLFLPRSQSGGIVLGETHTATLSALWYAEDPTTADDLQIILDGDGGISYNSGTGVATFAASAVTDIRIGVGSDPAPIGAARFGFALLGFARPQGLGLHIAYQDTATEIRRLRLDGDPSTPKYIWRTSGADANWSTDVTVTHDLLATYDGAVGRGYRDNPAPAQDDAVPAVTDARTITLATQADLERSGFFSVGSGAGNRCTAKGFATFYFTAV